MLRALAWKEWREQRPVLLGGLAFGVVVPLFVAASGGLQNAVASDIVEAIPVAFLGIVWPLLAAAAGAMTVANEDEGKTLTFLLSRPVSRRRLWLVKVAVATAAVVASAAFSIVVIRVAAGFAPGAADLSSTMGHELVATLRPVGLGSLSALLFACSVLCSTVLKRPLTAAAAALAMTLALLAVVLFVWSRLALVPRLEPQWFAAEVMVLAAGVLLSSLIVFARGELFRGARLRLAPASGAPVLVGALVVTIALAGVLPGLYAAADIDTADVVIDPESIVLDGDILLMTVTGRDSGATQIRSLGTDGTGMRPSTGRYTLAPTLAGQYLLFRSRRGFTGSRGDSLDLRLADRGGFRERLVARDVPADVALFFQRPASRRLYSADRVMFLDGGELHVVRLDGGGHDVFDVGATPLAGGTLLGYSSENGTEALFLESVTPLPGGGHAATGIGAFNLASGASRRLHRLADGWRMPALPRRDGTSVPVAQGTGYPLPALLLIADDRIEVLDTGDGTTSTIHVFDVGDDPGERRGFDRCATGFVAAPREWLSDQGRSYREPQVLFADCTAAGRAEAGTADAAGLIRLRGRDSGDERTWALPAFEGIVNRLWLTRQQDRVLVDIRGAADATSYAVLLSLDDAPRVYSRGWIPRGPLRLDRFLLQGSRGGEIAFATLDAGRAPAALRSLYPSEQESR